MRTTLLASARRWLSSVIVASLAMLPTSATAQQQQQPPPPARPAQATTPAAETPSAPWATSSGQSRRAVLPQGFSVVLVLGDIQGAAAADDVPPAARKALVDMRDFLPFKSYKLLDAAWLMCCGQDARGGASSMLRGPDDKDYELKLETVRTDGARVSVRFSLREDPSVNVADASRSTSAALRTAARRVADLKDQRTLLEKQIEELRKKVAVGVAPGGEVPKLEMELRRVDREIEDLTGRMAHEREQRPATRTTATHSARTSIIDTSFTMDVGETVVVGTSRLKGGSRALIALLTAVPPRGTTERRE